MDQIKATSPLKKSLHLYVDRRHRFITSSLINDLINEGMVSPCKDGKYKIENNDAVIILSRDKSFVVTAYWKKKQKQNEIIDSLLKEILDSHKSIDSLLAFGKIDPEHEKIFRTKLRKVIKNNTFSKLRSWIQAEE